MRVAFLVPGHDRDVPAAVAHAVADHAARLRDEHGMNVAMAGPDDDPGAADVTVATWWDTTERLPGRGAARLLLTMEDRLHPPGSAEAEAAAASQELGIPTIVAARWIAEQLVELQPGVAVHHVREGIDKEAFAVADVLPPPAEDGPLRVLIVGEAQAPYDGVDAALAAVEAMEQRHSSTVLPRATARDAAARAAHYDAADVVVSCVRVAGMLTEPLEAFHRGATCVTTETTGHDEYVVDGRNGLVTSWDDDRGTARLLDLLAADRALLARLRAEALATARAWPSERDSGAALAAALRTIAAEAA